MREVTSLLVLLILHVCTFKCAHDANADTWVTGRYVPLARRSAPSAALAFPVARRVLAAALKTVEKSQNPASFKIPNSTD